MARLQTSHYNPDDCTIGVVHIGFGAFHRAHQAVYIDRSMQTSQDLGWGIAAVNLLASQSAQFIQMGQNHYGYVLKTNSASGDVEYQHIKAHIAFHDWPTSKDEAEALLAHPNVKMVTITVTESGYALNDQAGLDIEFEAIHNELLGQKPTTIYGYLRAALRKRLDADAGPITILNCDNLRRNGKLLRQNFLSYLKHCGDTELLDWVARHVRFPCSMVDRITPRPTPELTNEVQTELGIEGSTAVMAEDFIQWVIEDDFATDRPPLEQAGVQIVNDVDPYEETKIRILNGGHTALVYMGALMGYQSFDQLMRDPELKAHFHLFEDEEVIPALTHDLADNIVMPLEPYKQVIAERFSNPHIADSVARIAADGVSKFPIFILPTLQTCYQLGRTPQYALRSIAAWYHFGKKSIQGDIGFDYLEPQIALLENLLADPTGNAFAKSSQLWGELAQSEQFNTDLIQAINQFGDQINQMPKAQTL